MMAEGDRLGCLQMGESGHDGGGMGIRLVEQSGLQSLQLAIDCVNLVADPEPEVGRDLIVSRSRRVQPSGRISHELAQP